MNKEFIKKLRFGSLKEDFFELFRNILLKDIILFSIFPIILLSIMLLPEAIRQILSFSIYEPSWWQFFSHSFVHKDWGHFLNNLRGYLIFGFILFIFANKIKEKNVLFWLVLSIIISLPILSSLVEFMFYPKLLPMIKTSQGASGIVSALLGILPIFWIYYFSKKEKTNFTTTYYLNIVMLYVASLFVFIYTGIHKRLLINVALLTLFLFFIFIYRKNIKLILKSIAEESKGNILFYFILFFIPLFFILAPTILFPTNVIQGNSLVDFFMHYIGLVYGILISFIFFKVKFSRPPV